MYENFDGSSSNQTKGAQNVAGRLGVEPEDCVSFSDHDECLREKKENTINVWMPDGTDSKNTFSKMTWWQSWSDTFNI